MLIAYIQDRLVTVPLEEQIAGVATYNYHMIYIDKSQKRQRPFTIIEQMQPQDTLLVYQLACLGLSLRSLSEFLKEIKHRQLSFISIQDQIQFDGMQTDSLFLYHLDLLIETDKRVRSRRTIESLKKRKKSGKAFGRPAIAQQKIDEILRLHKRHYSYRKIAMICEVSVGVVHKYIKKETEKQVESEGKK